MDGDTLWADCVLGVVAKSSACSVEPDSVVESMSGVTVVIVDVLPSWTGVTVVILSSTINCVSVTVSSVVEDVTVTLDLETAFLSLLRPVSTAIVLRLRLK